MVRKTGAKSLKAGRGYQGSVSIRHVEVLEAQSRLEQALELLLAPVSFSDETIPDTDMVPVNHNQDSKEQGEGDSEDVSGT